MNNGDLVLCVKKDIVPTSRYEDNNVGFGQLGLVTGYNDTLVTVNGNSNVWKREGFIELKNVLSKEEAKKIKKLIKEK